MEYPIFKYPSILAADNYNGYSIQPKPIPTKPQKEKIPKPDSSFFTLSFWIIIIFIIIGFNVPEMIGFCILLVVILVLYRVIKKSGIRAEYMKKIQIRNREYQVEITKYNTAFSLHELEKKEAAYIKTIKATEKGDMRKAMILKHIYDKKNVIIEDAKQIKKGITEDYFFQKLKEKFGSRILRSKSVKTKHNYIEYFPDFIYYDNVRQIYIDIEIDEPYDLLSGLPIHYQGQDDLRDNFFISINWIVLRFTEYQIHHEPQNCISEIEEVIKLFEYGLALRKTFVSTQNHWSLEEAQSMEKSFYRESYLNLPKKTRTIPKTKDTSLKKEQFKSKVKDLTADDDLPF